jgi:mono/diheme cytochrome c family protein
MRRHVVTLLGATLLSSATLIGMSAPGRAQSGDLQRFDEVEKGRYLAIAADCGACHLSPDGRQPFAGGRPIETPFGAIVAPNITPDQETGIGGWSDDQFVAAIRTGVRPDGKHLYPAMPYTAYTRMPREDVLAIRAYLQTLQPVRHPVTTNTLPFPFNIRAAMRLWNLLYFRDGEFAPDRNKPPAWNRGAYLVEGPGHCGTCHTPKSMLGGDKSDQALAGAALQGWFAPNLTGDEASGLGKWSVGDIVDYLKTGHNAFAGATGPMAEEIEESSALMTDDDLQDIAAYLKTLPAKAGDAAPPAADATVVAAGQAIYRDQCAACHGIEGKGVDRLFPALAGSSAVRAANPAGLIHIVLSGARSVATDKEPTGPGMPAYGWQLDDGQVAAVLTYLRQSAGAHAAAVAPGDVAKVRATLAARTD